ncbi:response regulator [Aeromonas hydrophila]
MDITLRANMYEGVTADIIGIISGVLKTDIVAKQYPSREAAIKAVLVGDADFIGSSNSYEIGEGLDVTKPYISDEPAIYKRFGIDDNHIKRVAVAESYLPFSELLRYLPGVKVDVYPSRYAAVASVAYGKADAVLIDMISGNFIVNKFHQDSIQLVRPIYADTSGFSFGIRPGNNIVKKILNASLSSISEMHVSSILKRWSGGGLSIHSDLTPLTRKEWQWVNGRGVITIAVNTHTPPLSFVDEKGNLHGVVADISQVIKAKLGVQVNILPVATTLEQIAMIQSGRADLMIMTPNMERREKFIFTRAFALDPLVYVTHDDNQGVDPEALLRLSRVAWINGFIASIEARRRFKARYDVFFDRIDDALTCVSRKRCDVTIMPLRGAKFFINSQFPDSLHIAGELFDSNPIGASFAALPSQSELIAVLDKVLSHIPPDELEGLATMWRVNAKNETITWQGVLREYGVIISVVMILFLGGLFWGLLLRREVKQRQSAEIALGTQLKFVEELVESTPHPIYARGRDGKIILCNDSYARLLNFKKDELMGSTLSDIESICPAISVLNDIFLKTLDDGQSRDGDYRLTLPHGEVDIYHWLQVYRDLSGEIQGAVGGWIDISERVSLLHELAEASRAKSTFLATMSHEIRTPMNAIIGLLELTLRKGGLNEEDRDAIQVAYQSSTDLLGLIGDILDLSKIESGKLELSPAPHRISELGRAVINVFSAVARQKGLTLTLTCQGDVTVLVDSIRYKQVLSNLVSNAIKFTRKGGVDLAVECQVVGSWCDVKVSVTDSGIGISKHDLQLLFQPFTQASQPTDMQRSGTGLGLMISRTLCQMMGGELYIESEIGQGTTVFVHLKLPFVDVPPMPDNESHHVSERKPESQRYQVLIVDDHPTNRLLVTQQLTFLGHEVQAADSGSTALAYLKARGADVIITDFNMPEIDGLEFTTRYRQQECDESRERAIIIGLTADARQEQIQKAMEAGMDDCLFKPVSLDELKQCLSIHTTGYVDSLPSEIANSINQRLGPLTAGKPELAGSLLGEFLRATDDDLDALAAASQAGDNQAFMSNLHRLKGGARIIGADGLVACCIAWEQSSRLPLCMPSALRQVRHIYRQLKEGIRYWEGMR